MGIPVTHLIRDLRTPEVRCHQEFFRFFHTLSDQVFDKGDAHFLGKDGRKMIRADIRNGRDRIQ